MTMPPARTPAPLFAERPESRARPVAGDVYARGDVSIHFDRAESLYERWPTPTCIVSDGPYGIGGFPGDSHDSGALAQWYEPHVRAWSAQATPGTTLWFWNSELGWANVHPVLAANGWAYRCCNVWDKGMGHVAGNANTRTLRKFPVVTEVCVHYVKMAEFRAGGRTLTMQEWLRREWRRTGLPFRLANEACGVRNAATRKYLTGDHVWYYPPPAAFERMALFANERGDAAGRPYFSIDGRRPLAASEWEKLRAKFDCPVGVTNVWREPQVGGAERIRGTRERMKYKFKSLHGSQKPLKFVDLSVRSSTGEGDVVWEPFGGLCPGAVVSRLSSRRYRGAEIIPEFYAAAIERLARS